MGRTIATLSEADPDPELGYGVPWIAAGIVDYDKKGAARRAYVPWSYSGSVDQFSFVLPPGARHADQRYDAFGRTISTTGLDGSITSRTAYHALSVDRWDAEDIGPGPHQGTYASEQSDGLGRVTRTTTRIRVAGQIEQHHLDRTYMSTGEVTSLTRRRGSAESVQRTMAYDTIGRMVLNLEPNTSGSGAGWRYAYSDSGALVATSDARGCGSNFAYDAGGRALSEDYSPCQDHHGAYTPEPEVEYRYDVADPEAASAGITQQYTLGRTTSVRDRGSKSLGAWDGKGRATHAAKKIAAPDGSFAGSSWFVRQFQYDGAGRPIHETTGASRNLGLQNTSAVISSFTKAGRIKQVDSTFGLLVHHVKRDAEGLTKEIQYGDAAGTTKSFLYDSLNRVRNLTTYRANVTGWTNSAFTQQMLLQDMQVTYDRVGNPTEIRDWRIADEWPAGAKPVTRKMQYDNYYRLTKIDYQHTSLGPDTWKDPFEAETTDSERPQPSPRGDFSGSGRVLQQAFAYDWLGNQVETDDNTHGFYDRSLGTASHGTATQGPYQLLSATNTSKGGSRTGSLSAKYDAAGYLIELTVRRSGQCIGPAGYNTLRTSGTKLAASCTREGGTGRTGRPHCIPTRIWSLPMTQATCGCERRLSTARAMTAGTPCTYSVRSS